MTSDLPPAQTTDHQKRTGRMGPAFVGTISVAYDAQVGTHPTADAHATGVEGLRDRIAAKIDMAARDDLEAAAHTPIEGTNEDRLRHVLCARIADEIRDFSQVEAAAWLGISQAKVSAILNGKTAGVLSLPRLLSILDDLGIVLRV